MLIFPQQTGDSWCKQLRNSTKITQLRAHTNIFAQSPIPCYICLLYFSYLVLYVALALYPSVGVVFSLLSCLPVILASLYVCLYDTIQLLDCNVMLLKSYHIIMSCATFYSPILVKSPTEPPTSNQQYFHLKSPKCTV